MLIGIIVACEVAFWIVLALGLFVRYILRSPKAGKRVLLGIPALDIILLTTTIIDLRRGSVAEFAHGLAAVYLGFTVVFGGSVIRWADQRYAYLFGGGRKPNTPGLDGWQYTVYEWKLWAKGALACTLAALFLGISIKLIDQPGKTEALVEWLYHLAAIVTVWLIFGPVWYTLSPKQK